MRRKHRIGTVAAAVMVAAWAGGLPAAGPGAVPAKPDDRTIVHVLNRIGYGPGPHDVARVREIGLQKHIDQQLDPERIDGAALAARLAAFHTLAKSSSELADQYFIPAQQARRVQQPEERTPMQSEAVRAERLVLAELMQAKIVRAIHSERQLEEVMVDFWFNHFNVFAGKGLVRVYLHEYERDVIRPHALGRFRDLLQATAESPAMLFYLDNWQSAAPDAAATAVRRRPRPVQPQAQAQPRRRGLNENYARELMELHTLGVDGGYTQKDVQEVARAFSGWTIDTPRQGGGFRFQPRMHDDGAKIVLGQRLEPGGGKRDGDKVIAILAKHPSTARFISTKLARRFVADAPPPALIERAARRFQETDGDIREVVRLIITSPEFFASTSYRAKVKTPFEFVVSAARATGVPAENALPLVQAVRTLGMPLYGCQPPTGYADTADAWVNSGALLSRMNFAVELTSPRGARLNGAPAVTSSDALVASALAGDISASTAATIAKASTPAQALALALGSPEFQKR